MTVLPLCRLRPAGPPRSRSRLLSQFGCSAVGRLTDGSSAGWKPALRSELGHCPPRWALFPEYFRARDYN